MSNLRFIPSHNLEAVDTYNKQKLITTNKITPATGINETAKIPQLKLSLYFSIINIITSFITSLIKSIYIERERERDREREK